MTSAVGPNWAAGFTPITKGGYQITFLADLRNDELQQEGQAPVFYYLPNSVRLARKDGDNGDYIFSFIHFEGVRNASTNVGVTGQDNEVTGGLLTFATTASFPGPVLQEAEDDLLNRFRGSSDKYWGWRTPVAPRFRPAVVMSSNTTVSNLSPTQKGMVPSATGGRGIQSGMPREFGLDLPPLGYAAPRSVPMSDAYRSSNLDMWYVNMTGQGATSVNPDAINAFSALTGSIPAALIWSSFHGGTGAITVSQNLKLKVWSPAVHITIEGDWDRIQDHFSAAGHASGLFWSADVQAQFNNLCLSGDIKTKIEVDNTIPGIDGNKLNDEMSKRSDLVFQKFMDQAQKTIFDPAPYQEQPAQASGGLFGLGGGVAFKMRHDHSHLHLKYEETREYAYLQDYPISGALEGLYDVIKKDPSAEKKYFTTLYLGDWERKVSRNVKSVVNWPDPAHQWVGEPVAFLSAQVGYPNTQGVVQWDGHVFQSTDQPETTLWNTNIEMKAATDVANAPAGWKPDMTFLKRQIHFNEPPSETQYPYFRVSVEKNVVDLDPGPNGTLTNDINLEVRVDSVGTLSVGPITIDAELDGAKQIVEVTFQCEGNMDDGNPRAPVKFEWTAADQDEPRYWTIFTGQPGFVPKYKYQVRVIVKGSIFTKGMNWLGLWTDASGNGPLTVTVPTEEDTGVTVVRDFPTQASMGAAAGATGTTNSAPPNAYPPPATAPPPAAPSPAAPPPAVPAPAVASPAPVYPPPAAPSPNAPPAALPKSAPPTVKTPAYAATKSGYGVLPAIAAAPPANGGATREAPPMDGTEQLFSHFLPAELLGKF